MNAIRVVTLIASIVAFVSPLGASEVDRGFESTVPGDVVLLGQGWLSTEKNEYNLNTTADGQPLVFARSEASFAKARIYYARRQQSGWTLPQEAPFTDQRYRDSDPWLTPDGNWLYFVSDRPTDGGETPRRDFDIWRAHVADSHWSDPEHLAGSVNSDSYELGPEIHAGWLYFNSSRRSGPAKMSLYRAHLEGDGFASPEPLAAPFNEGEQQGDITFSPDGQIAMFWRKPVGSSDEGDLYLTTRQADGWTPALRLPEPFNAKGYDFTPQISADGTVVYFSSTRKGDVSQGILNGQSNVYAARMADIKAALHESAQYKPQYKP